MMKDMKPDTIRTYVRELTQKGYESDVVGRKLQSAMKYAEWAYQSDQLSYFDYQQIKDEIASFESGLHDTKPQTNFEAKQPQNTPLPHQRPNFAFDSIRASMVSRKIVALALLLATSTFVGIGTYQRFFSKVSQAFAAPTPVVAQTRVLAFEGNITDSLGNPITSPTSMRFRLYDAATFGNTLYDSGTCTVSPQNGGKQSVLIGSECGPGIPQSVFSENGDLYLGVTVGTDAEMQPRQRIANVPYALNSETLQGLPLGTGGSQVPYINQDGDLLIASVSPQIASTFASETFLLSSAKAITLQSSGDGDVTLNASESGTIKFLAGGSEAGHFDSQGNLILAQNHQIQLGSAALDPIPAGIGALYYNTLDESLRVYTDSGWAKIGSSDSVWKLADGILSPTETQSDILIGGIATSSALVRLPGTRKTDGFFNTGGNFGINTTTPDAQLDILSESAPQLRLTQTDNAIYSDLRTDGSGNLNINTYNSGKILLNSSNSTFGTAASNTLTFNAANWTAANDTNLTLGGGVNGLSFDGSTLSIDASHDRVGIGTTSPDAKFQITGTAEGKALTILNETGDQNILVASGSGTGVFSIAHNGDVSRLDSNGVNALPDQGSIAPNGSFEVDSNGDGTPDGWADIAAGDTIYNVTGGAHGDSYLTILGGGSHGVVSTCFPVSKGQTYQVHMMAKQGSGAPIASMLSPILQTFPQRSDCEGQTNGTDDSGTASTVSQDWGSTGDSVTVTSTNTWARVKIINLDSAENLLIDAVKVVSDSESVGLDVAETYPVNPTDNIQVAEIVAFGSENKNEQADIHSIKRSSGAYDSHVFGIVATQPGITLDDKKSYPKAQIALKGRVPVRVTTENGPIHIGDPITSSRIPGVGMKATRSGKIVGYAMSEQLNPDPHQVESVTVFVNPEMYVDLSILTDISEVIKQIPTDVKNMTVGVLRASAATIDSLIVDRLVARDISTENLSAQKITSKSVSTDTIETKSASISGTLVADKIEATNIRELRDRLEKVAQEQSGSVVDSQKLNSDVEKIQTYISELTHTATPENITDTETYQILDKKVGVDPGTMESIFGETIPAAHIDNLTVTGTSSISSLVVADAFSAGELYIDGNSLLSMSNELKLSALENVNIMDGAVIIAHDGTITSKGEVIAEKGVRTNTLKPADGGSVSVVLPSDQDSSFTIANDSGAAVAGINASGSARFADLSLSSYRDATSSAVIVAAGDTYKETGMYSPSIKTNAAASGNGILPTGENHIIIFNDKLTADSLVHITPTSSTNNGALYVDKVEACSASTNTRCKPYFRVTLDASVGFDVTFNWLVVGGNTR